MAGDIEYRRCGLHDYKGVEETGTACSHVLSQLCIYLPKAKELVVYVTEVVTDIRLDIRPLVSNKLQYMAVK